MLLKNASVVNDDFRVVSADIRTDGDRIVQIGALQSDPGETVLDLSGCYVLPGLIDTHIHGAFNEGIDCSDADGLLRMAVFEATQGVTSFAITSAAPDGFDAVLEQMRIGAEAARRSQQGEVKGSKIVAIHAEGPFLSQRRSGAMDPNRFLSPTPERLDAMMEAADGYLKLLTVAPENEGAYEFIQYAVSRGLTVSLGHSVATYDEALAGMEAGATQVTHTTATYEQAQAAIRAGATQTTHTFNAMRPYSHREPGILGAALLSEKVKCEMICDYVHLHPATVQLIYRLKGVDKVNMISDSVNLAGSDQTELDFDGVKAYIQDGVIRRADGTIAGSAMTLLNGVQNLLRDGYPVGDVAKMAAYNGAKTLGIDQQTGSIAPGKLADLMILDSNFRLLYTFVNGKCVYKAE